MNGAMLAFMFAVGWISGWVFGWRHGLRQLPRTIHFHVSSMKETESTTRLLVEEKDEELRETMESEGPS